MYTVFAPSYGRNRYEDACHDINMAAASLLIAIERAKTVDEALAIRVHIRQVVDVLEGAESLALRKADAL
jgi:NifU-like protein involved in Fe-S cluster formation